MRLPIRGAAVSRRPTVRNFAPPQFNDAAYSGRGDATAGDQNLSATMLACNQGCNSRNISDISLTNQGAFFPFSCRDWFYWITGIPCSYLVSTVSTCHLHSTCTMQFSHYNIRHIERIYSCTSCRRAAPPHSASVGEGGLFLPYRPGQHRGGRRIANLLIR